MKCTVEGEFRFQLLSSGLTRLLKSALLLKANLFLTGRLRILLTMYSFLVDGNWGPWSTFGGCSKTCGGGMKYRKRKCDNPAPANGGMDCQGSSNEAQHCNVHPCAGEIIIC